MMTKKSLSRALLIIGLTGSTLFLYNNCSGGLPAEVNNPSSSSSSSEATPASGSTVLNSISASIQPASIYTDETAQLNVSGGNPPFTFAVTQGTASISSTGRVSGGYSLGMVYLRVTDSAKQTVTVALVTATRPTTPTTPVTPVTPTTPPPVTYANCPLPWGGSIAHGASVTAWNTSSIVCPAAGSCAAEVRTCSNGALSGSYTAPSCSTTPCAHRQTAIAREYNSGNRLCGGTQQGGDNGGINYSIPQISDPSQLPSCDASQYNISKYCLIRVSGGGDNGSSYEFNLFTCRGQNEAISIEQVAPDNSGGGN